MIDLVWSVRFEDAESVIQLRDFVLKLNRRGGLYVLELQVQDARRVQSSPELMLMPVEDETSPMLAEDSQE